MEQLPFHVLWAPSGETLSSHKRGWGNLRVPGCELGASTEQIKTNGVPASEQQMLSVIQGDTYAVTQGGEAWGMSGV